MKKVFSILLIVMFVFSMNIEFAANDQLHFTDYDDAGLNSNVGIMTHDFIDINLDVQTGIGIDCGDSEVTMTPITQDGESVNTAASNEQACIVRTNNSAGYSLAVAASGTTNLTSGTDVISTLISSVSIPDDWAVALDASGWGYRLMADSASYGGTDDPGWAGTDDYDGNWLAFSGSNQTIGSHPDETDDTGNTETLLFGAEIGTDKIQPTGTYVGQVTVTATTL